MKKVYFDNAATTRIDDSVIEKMNLVMKESYGNPSSTHGYGRESRVLIEKARKSIANEFNVQPSEIIFTSGGTESDNIMLTSAVEDLKVDTIITTEIEHHAVLNVVKHLNKRHSIDVKFLKIDSGGQISLKDLRNALDSVNNRALVSLMHINNEVGSVINLEEVGNICKEYGAIFHSDTVQSIGRYKFNLSSLNVDYIVGSAHKFHGPKGVGFLYANKDLKIQPLLIGGSQERGLRAGTESVHNITGMESAFLLAYENLDKDMKYIKSLKIHFIQSLKKNIPSVKFNANCDNLVKSTYTIINVCLPLKKEKSVLLEFNLDLKGIACSRGSACQSGSSKGSHVLLKLLNNDDIKKPSIRFSLSKYNTIDEVDYVVKSLKEFIDSN